MTTSASWRNHTETRKPQYWRTKKVICSISEKEPRRVIRYQACSSTQFCTKHWKNTFRAGKRKKGMGIHLSDNYHDCPTNRRFADDVVLFASSEEQLRKMLCEFKQSTEKLGLRIHPGKTKILSNQSSDTRKEIEADNIRVGNTDKRRKHEYLGRWLLSSNRRRPKSEIESGLLVRRFTSTDRDWRRKTICCLWGEASALLDGLLSVSLSLILPLSLSCVGQEDEDARVSDIWAVWKKPPTCVCFFHAFVVWKIDVLQNEPTCGHIGKCNARVMDASRHSSSAETVLRCSHIVNIAIELKNIGERWRRLRAVDAWWRGKATRKCHIPCLVEGSSPSAKHLRFIHLKRRGLIAPPWWRQSACPCSEKKRPMILNRPCDIELFRIDYDLMLEVGLISDEPWVRNQGPRAVVNDEHTDTHWRKRLTLFENNMIVKLAQGSARSARSNSNAPFCTCSQAAEMVLQSCVQILAEFLCEQSVTQGTGQPCDGSFFCGWRTRRKEISFAFVDETMRRACLCVCVCSVGCLYRH